MGENGRVDDQGKPVDRKGFEALIQAAIDYRAQERLLHLQLEDRCRQLATWATGVEGMGESEAADEVELVSESILEKVAPILEKLRTLRGGVPGMEGSERG